MKAEDIEGYRGKEDLDSILSFIDGEAGRKKKKAADKVVEKKKKSDGKEEKGDKVRRKKEKSVEKESNGGKAGVTKKLSLDNSSEAEVIEEEEEDEEEVHEEVVVVEQRSHLKGSPSSLASCGRANSAPSNDSGHVSAEPCSLPSVSSTKVLLPFLSVLSPSMLSFYSWSTQILFLVYSTSILSLPNIYS